MSLDPNAPNLINPQDNSLFEVYDEKQLKKISFGSLASSISNYIEVGNLDQYSVKSFGAVGNGSTDDTNAIQGAINAVSGAGGGILYFPKGTYLLSIVNPEAARPYSLLLKPNVYLVGFHRDFSILKLANNQGNYWGILHDNFSQLTNVLITNLTIDQNQANNIIEYTDDADWSEDSKPRFIIYATSVSSKAIINNCRFTNCDNRNTIALNGNIKDIIVENNIFDNHGVSPIYHDHSAVYLQTSYALNGSIIVRNNYFYGVSGADGARTAIETHGSYQIVSGNSINGFQIGMNITGVASLSHNINVFGNNIYDCAYGISLWSYNPGILNCNVSNNTIIIDYDNWERVHGAGPSGIILGDCEYPIVNLSIENNLITFLPVLSGGNENDNFASGIKLNDTSPPAGNANWKITNNVINNSPAAGIAVTNTVTGLLIDGNIIRNANQFNGIINSGYGNGIYLFGATLTNVKVSNNLITDDQTTRTLVRAFYANPTSAINCELSNNNVHVANGSLSADIIGSTWFNSYSSKAALVASLPTAGIEHRGKIVRTEGATNVADAAYICLKLANNTYSWVQIN